MLYISEFKLRIMFYSKKKNEDNVPDKSCH